MVIRVKKIAHKNRTGSNAVLVWAYSRSSRSQSEKGLKNRTELLALANQQKEKGKRDLAEFIINRGPKAVAEALSTGWEIAEANKKLKVATHEGTGRRDWSQGPSPRVWTGQYSTKIRSQGLNFGPRNWSHEFKLVWIRRTSRRDWSQQ